MAWEGNPYCISTVPMELYHLKASGEPKIQYKGNFCLFGKELPPDEGFPSHLQKTRMGYFIIEHDLSGYTNPTIFLGFDLCFIIKLQYLSRKGSVKIWLKLRYKWDSKINSYKNVYRFFYGQNQTTQFRTLK